MRTACAVAAIAVLSITPCVTAGHSAVSLDLARLLSIERPDAATAMRGNLPTVVPSPGTLALLGAAALVARRGRKRK